MERTAVIADIAAADFDQRVVQASHQRPVVVDFWAPWCGPCHHLSPLLERVAQRYAHDVDVVKLNIDTAQEIARRFQIQGIPAVKAFKDGGVAAEFVGVQPEANITQFFDGLVPSPADRLVTQAAPEDTDALQAAAESGDPAACLRLGRSLAAADRHAEALGMLLRAVTDPAVGDDARSAVLSIFEVLGPEHELVRAWRPKLAAALF